MKRQCVKNVALLVATLAGSSMAEVSNIKSGDVTSLVKAVNNTAVDEINIEPGVYDFSALGVSTNNNYATSYMTRKTNPVILRGTGSKHWSEKTAEEEVVFRGGDKGSIFYAHGQNPRRSAIYNITFENGYQPEVDKNVNKVGGGAVSWAATDGCSPQDGFGILSNCVFRNCGSSYSGGATYGVDAIDCLYTNCTSGGNGGGAYGFFNRMANNFHTNVFVNCVFIDCVAATNGGGLYCREIDAVTGCSFVGNYATNSCGGLSSGTMGGLVERCIFKGNDAKRSRLGRQIDNIAEVRDCLFSGFGDIHAKSIDRCRFEEGESDFVDNSTGYVTFDAATGDGWLANSLFCGCETPRLITNAGVLLDVVNCTFVNNSITGNSQSKDFLFYTFKSANGTTATNRIANCLFSGNKVTGEDLDVNFYATASALNVISNSLYVSRWGGTVPERVNFSKSDKIRFAAGTGRYANSPYYMIKRTSAAFDAGFDMPWMAAGTDLAGSPRLVGDHVDIGCYECVVPESGTKFSIR